MHEDNRGPPSSLSSSVVFVYIGCGSLRFVIEGISHRWFALLPFVDQYFFFFSQPVSQSEFLLIFSRSLRSHLLLSLFILAASLACSSSNTQRRLCCEDTPAVWEAFRSLFGDLLCFSSLTLGKTSDLHLHFIQVASDVLLV